MKRMLLVISGLAVIIMAISSCAATNRDCQGVKHYRLKNGIYI